MAFRVKSGHRRVRFGREAGGRRQRSLDVVKAEQARGDSSQEGRAPAGRRGHVHRVQRQPQHIRQQLPPAGGQGAPARQPETRRAMISEQGIQSVADRERRSLERGPQERRPVVGQRQRGPGTAQRRIGIRGPFARQVRDKIGS
jgi:hypothetical protein